MKHVSWVSNTQIPAHHPKISTIRECDGGLSDILNIFRSMILRLSNVDAWPWGREGKECQ